MQEVEIQNLRLVDFVRQAWHVVEPGNVYVHGWHIDAICEHLEAVSRGQIRDLLINMPPRHAKSLLVSVFWPVWEWLTVPTRQFAFYSYKDELSLRDNVKCRMIIQSPWFQKTYGHIFQLRKDQNQKGKFENNFGGYRFASHVGTGTGFGGDRIVCFTGDTKIQLEMGVLTIKEIVENEVRGNVLSFSKKHNTARYKPILKHFVSEAAELVKITLSDGTLLKCTPEHPIFNISRGGWIFAKDFYLGDIVMTQEQRQLHVSNIDYFYEPTKVYNLEIGENNNYFANNILVHNCLPWDETIETEDGPLPIGYIVDNKLEIKVWSYNETSGEKELKPIINWFENPGDEIFEIETEEGKTVCCTPDHQLLTANRGWVRADGLNEEDEIICF